MTSEGNGKIANLNKPKALSAISVGGVSYPFVMLTLSNWLNKIPEGSAWAWLDSTAAHHWIGLVVAAVMGGIAAYRTKDTSEEPTKWQQKRDAKQDQRTAASLARLNGDNGGNGDH